MYNVSSGTSQFRHANAKTLTDNKIVKYTGLPSGLIYTRTKLNANRLFYRRYSADKRRYMVIYIT